MLQPAGGHAPGWGMPHAPFPNSLVLLVDPPTPKTENRFSTREPPHSGQAITSDGLITRVSNGRSHFLQSYS